MPTPKALTPVAGVDLSRAPKAVKSSSTFGLTLACFYFSGFAGLLYEVVWQRQFHIALGSSELAVCAVLAAYMTGLAVGSAIAGRWMVRTNRPILVYALLELGIGVTALAVPLGIAGVRWLQIQIWGGQDSPPSAGNAFQTVFFFAGTLLTVIVPTALMGATLPMLSRSFVRTNEQVGSRVAVLYAINTFGAVSGTLAASFLLIPNLGLRYTTIVGAALNLLVFALAARVSKSETVAVETDVQPQSSTRPLQKIRTPEVEELSRFAWMILPLMLLSGAASFTYEILWTRLLGHVVGGSNHAFAIMLAAFLTGIALGSAIAGPIARGRKIATIGFAVAQLGTVIAALIFYGSLPWVADVSRQASGAAQIAGAGTMLLAGLLLLPTSLFIGATFPLAVRTLARDSHETPIATGRVYAWNTIGCITGALAAPLFVIPEFGFQATLVAAVSANLIAAASTVFFVPRRWRLAPVALAGAGVMLLAFASPGLPIEILRASPVLMQSRNDNIAYLGVGRSTTVALIEQDNWYFVRTNGMQEGGIRRRGLPPVSHAEELLSTLPVIARPASRSMLVVGYGAGRTVELAPKSLDRLDVIELEPEVIAANRHASAVRAVEPLDDPRLRIVINDARGALTLTDARYDIIVSQPSHPWSGGAAHLFSREYFSIVRDHLSEGGVFTLWLSLKGDPAYLRMLSATLSDVFANVRLYRFHTDVIFLASANPIEPELEWCRLPESSRTAYAVAGLAELESLLALLALDDSGVRTFCAGAAIVTDDKNPFSCMPARALNHAFGADGFQKLILEQGIDPLLGPESSIVPQLPGGADTRLLALRVHRNAGGTTERWKRVSALAPNERSRLLANASIAFVEDRAEESERLFEAVRRIDPRDQTACFMSIRPHLDAIGRGTATKETLELADRLTGVPAAVVQGWKHSEARNVERIRELDPILATAKPGDAWYRHAVYLRALGRVAKLNHSGRSAEAQTALEIVDRALLNEWSLRLVVMRARVAVAANNADALIGTAKSLSGQLSAARGDVSPAEAEAVREISGHLQRFPASDASTKRQLAAARDQLLRITRPAVDRR